MPWISIESLDFMQYMQRKLFGDPRNTDGEIFIKHRKGYDVNEDF